MNHTEVIFLDILENVEYEKLANQVIIECFKQEGLEESNLYISITLTNNENIKETNKTYRNIDKSTDVLSFPIFTKSELDAMIGAGADALVESKSNQITEFDILGDIIISIPKVEEQAKEYGHSFKREFSYMLVHGFYHLMGYDHIEENDKCRMRFKEEIILGKVV